MADNDVDFSGLAEQMNALAGQGDVDKANQLLAQLAQAPQGNAARPQSPLEGAVSASRAPVPAPDFTGGNAQMSDLSSLMPSGSAQAAIQQGRQQEEGERQAASGAMRPRPILFDLLDSITGKNIGGPSVPGYNPPSKLDHFNTFLGNFMQALSAGFSNAGTGPGAAMRGAGAAIEAPYQAALQRQQLAGQQQAQQAQIATERLKGQLTQAQIDQMQTSIPIRMPDGSVVYAPARDAGKLYGSIAGAQGKISAAQIAAENKLSVESMKEQLSSGKIVKTLPAQDKDGNIGVMGYNAQGQPVGFMQGALPPSAYMPKTSTTTDYVQTDGGLLALPKSTTTGVQLPSNIPQPIQKKITGGQGVSGGLPPQVKAARNRATGGGGARLVTGPDGKPIYSKEGPTQISGIADPFGNPVGVSETGMTMNRKEYDAAQKVFNKDYVEPINRLAKTQAEFESIKNDPNQTGAQKVTALLAAVGISGDALQGKGFRISNEVINEHANARNIWQSFVQKWNKVAGSGGPITSSQIDDYTKIAQGVVHDSYVQAAREAKRQGLPIDFLPKPTSQNQKADDGILKIYVDSANGDVQKAHKALTAAGWR